MWIHDAGHTYELEDIDGEKSQMLFFVKRMGDKYPFNNSSRSGTNCQEVLRVLIDRCEYLNKQKPCAETESIISCLKTALLLFELRASREHGHTLDLVHLQSLMCEPTCKTCGHIKCKEHTTGSAVVAAE